MIESVVVIQPPLVQLNAPYPSGAYLSAFFRAIAADGIAPSPGAPAAKPPAPLAVRWIDAANGFFRAFFSRAGLERLFDLCEGDALSAAVRAEAGGDDESAFQLRRFVSSADRWLRWIDPLVSILCGGDRELCHAFVRSPDGPRGARMDRFLSSLDEEPTADHARTLATLALEDIADFVAVAFDPEFSLVRYAESIASSVRDFSAVEAALERPVVERFMRPYFGTLCESLRESLGGAPGGSPCAGARDGQILFCVSVPFPGCLVGALCLARVIRATFGSRAVISVGGGYVNTELRDCRNGRFFSYIDHLSLDRGYGGYAALFLREWGAAGEQGEDDVRVAAGSADSTDLADLADSTENPARPLRVECPPELRDLENEYTARLVPDYRDIDFSLYPRLADTANPMHRLWSDGAWMKAYLAHGCYWHRCSFCDVTLDYIKGYLPVDVAALHAGLAEQAAAKGARGIHFVDEAAPPRALRDFAERNALAGNPLAFWGNIRFEKTFSSDLARYLSAGGLVGVSGGIEIATPSGFKAVDKGIDLENLVATCAAFKEAGVLVHAYLMYGYWNETDADVIDSAEIMRQLFATGLVDSAFWHKFVLTRHSRAYAEWKARADSKSPSGARSSDARREGCRDIEPVEIPGDFADNDLDFAGSSRSERYTVPLDRALAAWMAGEGLDRPVRSWFPFRMPEPSVGGGLIEECIARYEGIRDKAAREPYRPDADYRWTATRPVACGAEGLVWWNLGDEVRMDVGAEERRAILDAAEPCRLGGPADGPSLARLSPGTFAALRRNGLVKISPL